MPLALISSAFVNGEAVPVKIYRDGAKSVAAAKNGPDDAKNCVLIIEDRRAERRFRHWAVYNIAVVREELPKSVQTLWLQRLRQRAPIDRSPMKGHGVHHDHFRPGALSVPNLDVPAQEFDR